MVGSPSSGGASWMRAYRLHGVQRSGRTVASGCRAAAREPDPRYVLRRAAYAPFYLPGIARPGSKSGRLNVGAAGRWRRQIDGVAQLDSLAALRNLTDKVRIAPSKRGFRHIVERRGLVDTYLPSTGEHRVSEQE